MCFDSDRCVVVLMLNRKKKLNEEVERNREILKTIIGQFDSILSNYRKNKSGNE